ncbi:uncharacterized protein [Nothobranchius furzeri]|uniref:uncharacterized protein n=1 Tax=Nothobranchius furzeri TaxID=105023 RepID=UPI003904690F
MFVPHRGSSVPHSDGGGEDGLNDGRVKLHHHLGRQLGLFQLQQKVHPLLGLFDQGADGWLPPKVMCDGGSEEAKGVHSGDGGVRQDEGERWGCDFPEVYNHLHCLLSIELQVVAAAPVHQPFHLPPVGGLITVRDEPDEGGVVRKLDQLNGVMARGAAVCLQGEEQRRKYTALWRSCANYLNGGTILPQPHALPSVRQEVSDPPAGGVEYVERRELVLEQSREDGVERRAEVHKQDPGVGSGGVQVLQDEVEGQVDGVVYRPISSVCELQRVQEGG